MQTETAIHSGRDNLGRPLTDGRYGLHIGGRSSKVLIETDVSSGDLIVRYESGAAIRLDEIDPRAEFDPWGAIPSSPTTSKVQSIETKLSAARAHRESLDRLEASVASELGCQPGDGSTLADSIMAAVRDGMGTAVDLLDLAGALRR